MGNWNIDLVDGEKFETHVISLLNQGRPKHLLLSKNTDEKTRKYFDAHVPIYQNEPKYEIKLDRMSKETNNVFFELFDPHGWKSGLMSTRAQFVIYGIYFESVVKVFQFPYLKLMEFLFCFPCKWKGMSGDAKATSGVVVYKDVITTRSFSHTLGELVLNGHNIEEVK